MLSPSAFRDLVSGRSQGWGATCLRTVLRVAEVPYTLVMRLRNRRYDCQQSTICSVSVPVISVGNLTLGGTGKTPLVEWLARHFRNLGVRVSIVSRGYGAELGQRNDEALELELALPDVPHLQNPNRVEAAHTAVDELATELIVLDDGFQHRRLARELDIVLLDATEPFGFEHVFPRGTLREPLAGLSRAHVIVLSRADMLEPSERRLIEQRVRQYAPQSLWCEVEHQAAGLLDANGVEQPLFFSPEEKVFAFCGIGNPAGFRHTLDSIGCNLTGWREFPDHHAYSREDVASLSQWVADADHVLCTRKDLVKLGVTSLGGVPLQAVSVQLRFLVGETELQEGLKRFVGE